ncbi:unnamed protein product [Bursaphelenchus okinawaensis]|uniref:PNPLA domain-containing protein n=1 Tax=Bursaphelenchus okinawaensis TaxID=465554 RepID=A0A811KGN0_9BILA|nr:unnamed protein product [Bursaphelenchus okinawaensis]CAG9102574.1 unnamed protein product [Bursaphelenchus okinawaensis]
MAIQENGGSLPRKPSVRFELNATEETDPVQSPVKEAPNATPNIPKSPNCCRKLSGSSTPTKFADPSKINLSFAGCGFLCVYHAGVCAAIKEYAPQLSKNKVYGASAGAIVGAGVICNVCVSAATSMMLQAASEAQRGTLKTLNPNFDLSGIVRKGLELNLPPDAHVQCTGRLFISLTRVSDYKNVMVSEYATRDELIQAIVCSSFIPIISGVRPPKFRGVEYVDGGLSNNQPIGDEYTLTVSPFAGEHDICPSDRDSASLLGIDFSNTNIRMTTGNLFRMITCFFPPSLDICSNICRQGFQDALVLLTKKGLAPCVRCLTIQSNVLPIPEYKNSFMSSRVRTASIVSNPSRLRLASECEKCYESEFYPEDATALFPSVLQTAFGEAKKAESRLFTYLNSFRIYRYSRRLMAPAILPFELAMYTAKTVQSWIYPKSAVDYFTQRLQATVELVQSILDAAQSSSSIKSPPSYRIGLAEVERRQSSLPSRRPSKVPNAYAALENREGELYDEGSADELVRYSNEHDAVLAYHYMDEKNQVQVCQIYDVNNPDLQRPCHGSCSRRNSTNSRPPPSNPKQMSSAGQRRTHQNSQPPVVEEEEDLRFIGGHDEDDIEPTMEMESLEEVPESSKSPINGEDSGLSLTEDSNHPEYNVKKRDACCSPIRRQDQQQQARHNNNNTGDKEARSSLNANRPSRASLFDGRSSQLNAELAQSGSLTSLLRRHTMGTGMKQKYNQNRHSMGSTKSINSGPAAYHYWPPISSDSEQDGNDTFFIPMRARSASSNAYDGEPEQSD